MTLKAKALQRALPFAIAAVCLGTVFSLAIGQQSGPQPASVQVWDWHRLATTAMSATGLIGLLLVFLNQRLTAREATKANNTAQLTQGAQFQVIQLNERLQRAETRADKLNGELVEIRIKLGGHIDQLIEEKAKLQVTYDALRMERHTEKDTWQAIQMAHEKERGEWNLKIAELQHCIDDQKRQIASLQHRIDQLNLNRDSGYTGGE